MNPVAMLAVSHLLAFCVGVGLTWWAAMRALRTDAKKGWAGYRDRAEAAAGEGEDRVLRAEWQARPR